MSKRGHSNVIAEKTIAWGIIDPKCETGIARIPINGGATVASYRELPPLALRLGEWQEIGFRMGWITSSGA